MNQYIIKPYQFDSNIQHLIFNPNRNKEIMDFYETHQILKINPIAKSHKHFFVFTLSATNNKHQQKINRLVFQQFIQPNTNSQVRRQVSNQNIRLTQIEKEYKLQAVNYIVLKPQYTKQLEFCFLRDFCILQQIRFMLNLFQGINQQSFENLNPYTVFRGGQFSVCHLPHFTGLEKHLKDLLQQQLKHINSSIKKEYLKIFRFAYTCYICLQSRSLNDFQRLTIDPLVLKNLLDCKNGKSQIAFQILALLKNIIFTPDGQVSQIVIEQYLRMLKEKYSMTQKQKHTDINIGAFYQKENSKKVIKRKSFKQNSVHQSFYKSNDKSKLNSSGFEIQTRLKHSNSLTSLTSGNYKGRKYQKAKIKYPYSKQKDFRSANEGEMCTQASQSIQFLKSYTSNKKSNSILKNKSNAIFPSETNTSQFYLSMTNNSSKGGFFGFNPASTGQSFNINTSSSFFKASATQEKLKKLNVKQISQLKRILSQSSDKETCRFIGSETEQINESMVQSKVSEKPDMSFSKTYFRESSQKLTANGNTDANIIKKSRKSSISMSSFFKQEPKYSNIKVDNVKQKNAYQEHKMKKRNFDSQLVSDILKKTGIQLQSKNIEVTIKPRVKKQKINSSVFSINEKLSNPLYQQQNREMDRFSNREKSSQSTQRKNIQITSRTEQLKKRIIFSHLDNHLTTPTKTQNKLAEHDQLQEGNFSRVSNPKSSKNNSEVINQSNLENPSISKSIVLQGMSPQQKKMLENYSITLNILNKLEGLCSIQKVNLQLKFQNKCLFQICVITCFCKKLAKSLLDIVKSQKISEKLSILNSKYDKWKAALVKNPEQFFQQQNIKYLENFQQGSQHLIPSEQLAKIAFAQVQIFSTFLHSKKVTLDQMVIKHGLCYLVMMSTMINILANPMKNNVSWDQVKQKCKSLQEKQNIKMLNIKDYYNSNIKINIII